MSRWARPALASLALLATACPRPAPLVPEGEGGGGAEPELRVGLLIGVARLALGGDGELFVTDDGTGAPLGAIPAGATWQVVADSAGGAGLRAALGMAACGESRSGCGRFTSFPGGWAQRTG